MPATDRALIAGAGIGGLAAALACARAGWQTQVFERAERFDEVGAGLQLGPNAVRLFTRWGLARALLAVAARPERVQARDARSGRVLGELSLGQTFQRRYGAPYLTLHRADLHALLLRATQADGRIELRLDSEVRGIAPGAAHVRLTTAAGYEAEGHALIGADGLWSRVRAALDSAAAPQATGHCAYRALLRQSALPAALRSTQVTVWLGAGLHAVSYPVRGGQTLNLVLLAQQIPPPGATEGGEPLPDAAAPLALLAGACGPLRELAQAVPTAQTMQTAQTTVQTGQETAAGWLRWPLWGLLPLAGPALMARGTVALLGDAAHPMLPYLAQGAGMALEDAEELGCALAQTGAALPARLARYAERRWRRNAQVQTGAQRNGQIFHAQGMLRWGRDLSMRLLGARLMDQPWLYGGGPVPAG